MGTRYRYLFSSNLDPFTAFFLESWSLHTFLSLPSIILHWSLYRRTMWVKCSFPLWSLHNKVIHHQDFTVSFDSDKYIYYRMDDNRLRTLKFSQQKWIFLLISLFCKRINLFLSGHNELTPSLEICLDFLIFFLVPHDVRCFHAAHSYRYMWCSFLIWSHILIPIILHINPELPDKGNATIVQTCEKCRTSA